MPRDHIGNSGWCVVRISETSIENFQTCNHELIALHAHGFIMTDLAEKYFAVLVFKLTRGLFRDIRE